MQLSKQLQEVSETDITQASGDMSPEAKFSIISYHLAGSLLVSRP